MDEIRSRKNADEGKYSQLIIINMVEHLIFLMVHRISWIHTNQYFAKYLSQYLYYEWNSVNINNLTQICSYNDMFCLREHIRKWTYLSVLTICIYLFMLCLFMLSNVSNSQKEERIIAKEVRVQQNTSFSGKIVF